MICEGSAQRVKIGIALRKGRLLRRPSLDVALQLLTAAMVALLAVQAARLIWTVATPAAPLGEWKGMKLGGASMGGGDVAAKFDPFFRLTGQEGALTVTSLSLKLFGVRVDQATGRGSAIIATPDGVQSSFAVGDEIMPGVTLKLVSADGITIARDGAAEQIFIDQSVPALAVGATDAPPGGSNAQALFDQGATGGANLAGQIGLSPRTNGGQITGFVVNPEGSGQAFRAAGLQPDDVLLSVNGNRPQSIEESVAILDQLPPNGAVTLQIERGGKVMTINARGGQ
jgi:general secretion pathway protein C